MPIIYWQNVLLSKVKPDVSCEIRCLRTCLLGFWSSISYTKYSAQPYHETHTLAKSWQFRHGASAFLLSFLSATDISEIEILALSSQLHTVVCLSDSGHVSELFQRVIETLSLPFPSWPSVRRQGCGMTRQGEREPQPVSVLVPETPGLETRGDHCANAKIQEAWHPYRS